MTKSKCQLYLITPSKIEVRDFCTELLSTLRVGNIACVQLRLKNTPEDNMRKIIEAVLPITQDYGIPLILNDDPVMALETGCDGVHIGQEDTNYISTRKIVGRDAIVGVTCLGSIDLAMRAAEPGADYVAFGSFFASKTKNSAGKPKLEIIKKWSEITTVPSVAIGGITPQNCDQLVLAGADFLAVISAVWEHPKGPAVAVTEFNQVIQSTI
mgnify:FL=1